MATGRASFSMMISAPARTRASKVATLVAAASASEIRITCLPIKPLYAQHLGGVLVLSCKLLGGSGRRSGDVVTKRRRKSQGPHPCPDPVGVNATRKDGPPASLGSAWKNRKNSSPKTIQRSLRKRVATVQGFFLLTSLVFASSTALRKWFIMRIMSFSNMTTSRYSEYSMLLVSASRTENEILP